MKDTCEFLEEEFEEIYPGAGIEFPINYTTTMFVHVMSGNVIFILIPFTKLGHAILFPATQLVSEMGWHLAAESGAQAAIALGKEGEPV